MATLRELHFQAALLADRGVEAVFHPGHFQHLGEVESLDLPTLARQPLCLAEPTRYFRRYLDMALREMSLMPRVVVESASIMQLLQCTQVGLGVLVSPRGHLLPASLHGLEQRPVIMPKMARQAALVVAEPGRATPLAQHFYDEARSHLDL